MSAKKPSKVNGPEKSGLRITGAPREVGPAWTLEEYERERFIRAYGVAHALSEPLQSAHEDDREILTDAVAAALAFHELSDLIDRLEWRDGLSEEEFEDALSDLRNVRVGFELALRALDVAIGDRAKGLGRPREFAARRWEGDPRTPARQAIRREYERWCAGDVAYSDARQFAVRMHAKHAAAYKNERSIQNQVTNWGGAPKNHDAAE
jgi:hypothetical protein